MSKSAQESYTKWNMVKREAGERETIRATGADEAAVKRGEDLRRVAARGDGGKDERAEEWGRVGITISNSALSVSFCSGLWIEEH